MKSSGVFLLILGLTSIVLVLIPDHILLNWGINYNALLFINNELPILATFFTPSGIATFVAAKKRREMDYH